jgi:hypothetical protein
LIYNFIFISSRETTPVSRLKASFSPASAHLSLLITYPRSPVVVHDARRYYSSTYTPLLHVRDARRYYTSTHTPLLHVHDARRYYTSTYTPLLHAHTHAVITRPRYTPLLHVRDTRRYYTSTMHAVITRPHTRRYYTPTMHAVTRSPTLADPSFSQVGGRSAMTIHAPAYNYRW